MLIKFIFKSYLLYFSFTLIFLSLSNHIYFTFYSLLFFIYCYFSFTFKSHSLYFLFIVTFYLLSNHIHCYLIFIFIFHSVLLNEFSSYNFFFFFYNFFFSPQHHSSAIKNCYNDE